MDTDIIYANNVSRYPQCISRTKLGNCDPVGGFCTSVSKKICDLQKHESREGQLMNDFPSREAETDDWMEKCMTCKHVYQRIDDVDTLYCRCRKGCKYEEVKVRRSNHDPQRHEG